MNIFRLVADMLHLASILILLLKIWSTKNVKGISLKSQLLYVMVFCTRYVDLFWNFHSLYNTSMKVFFVGATAATVYLMKFQKPYCMTYDSENDSFNIFFLIIPCVILAFVWNIAFTPFEIVWAFSIYLESVTIIPQVVMVQRFAKEHSGSIENLTSDYMFCLGSYRALYLINWIWRLLNQPGYWDPIVWAAGIVQTAIYSDFLYYYVKAKWAQKTITLPV